MRAVVQRVTSASVEVDGRIVSEIGPGFSSSSPSTNPTPKPTPITFSQFTLYGTLKGNKPYFHVAMPPQKAKPFYESVVDKFRKSYKPDVVKDGVLAGMMKVSLVNGTGNDAT